MSIVLILQHLYISFSVIIFDVVCGLLIGDCPSCISSSVNAASENNFLYSFFVYRSTDAKHIDSLWQRLLKEIAHDLDAFWLPVDNCLLISVVLTWILNLNVHPLIRLWSYINGILSYFAGMYNISSPSTGVSMLVANASAVSVDTTFSCLAVNQTTGNSSRQSCTVTIIQDAGEIWLILLRCVLIINWEHSPLNNHGLIAPRRP